MSVDNNTEPSLLESIELDTMMTIGEKHANDLAVIDEAFNQIFEALRSLDKLPDLESEVDIQEARMSLAARIFKCLRSARVLLQYGCYEQALVLVRTSLEHRLVSYDIEIRPETLSALKSSARFNVGEIAYNKMVDRIGEVHVEKRFKEARNRTNKLLNDYVHPGGIHRQQRPFPGNTKGYALSFGSYYDAEMESVTQFLVVGEILSFMKSIQLILAKIGKDWQAEPIYEALRSLYEGKQGAPWPLDPV